MARAPKADASLLPFQHFTASPVQSYENATSSQGNRLESPTVPNTEKQEKTIRNVWNSSKMKDTNQGNIESNHKRVRQTMLLHQVKIAHAHACL